MVPLDPCSPPDLRHLRRLTNDVGIWQHTRGDVPDVEMGYSIDDVARALIVVSEGARLFPEQAGGSRQQAVGGGPTSDKRQATSVGDLADLYLKFIEHCRLPDGRFHNFVAADKTFRDDAGSLDSFGRTVWALGVAIRNSQLDTGHSELGTRAAAVLRGALPHFRDLPDLRSKAFALLGLLAVLESSPSSLVPDSASFVAASARLIEDLLHAYADTATSDWLWFEDTLRYSNGVLPFALLAAGQNSQRSTLNAQLAAQARDIGLRSVDFLLEKLPVGGVPAPVGNQWWSKSGVRPLYDQQCVDTAASVVAAAEAFRVTGEPRYRDAALTWWGWFFGNNTQKKSLYRPEDGAVYDGLTPGGVNENRGAESVLAFLLTHLALADTVCQQRKSGGRESV